MKPMINIALHLPARIFQEGDVYVSHCPTFDVYSQGNAPDEARKNLSEAITAFLITCFELGTLDEVLKESGFLPCAESVPDISPESDFINVPFPLCMASEHCPA